MMPVDQDRFGEDGNCFEACIASLLNLPLSAVPRFGEDPGNAALNEWLAPRGLYAVTLSGGQTCHGEPWVPAGLHVLGGNSAGGPHAVVARGAEIVHDPNPSRAGLVTREDFLILVPLDPGAA